MRTLTLTIALGFMTLMTFSQTNIIDLEEVDGLWTRKGESSPFNGDFVEKFDNGKTAATGTFKDGLLEGERIVYNEDGSRDLERNYQQGISNGIGKDYFDNGTLKQEGLFKDGKESGIWILYYESGEKRAMINFEDGKQQGSYKEYSKDGKLLRQFYAVDGKSGYSDEFNKYFNEAEDLRVHIKVQEAMPLYDKAIEINPTVAKAYFGRGECKGYTDFKGAIIDYDKAIKLNPKYMLAYRNRGTAKFNVYSSKGNQKPPPEQMESACYDLSQAKELGDTSDLSKALISEHCKKYKKKKKKK